MHPAVRVQLVVYQNDPSALRTTITAVRACIRHARSTSRISTAVVAVGDCSPTPCLSADQIRDYTELLSAVDAEVTYDFFDANAGSAGGSNRLAEAGDEELIWVLNPDTYPSPTCLSLLIDALTPASVAASEGRQTPIEHPKGYDPTTGEATWLTGACMLLKRAAFDAVGGFDARFFPMYCDDVDLSWRLRLHGYTLRTVPRATVFHDKRPGLDGRPSGSAFEQESGAAARLLLARRFGGPEVEQHELAQYADGDNEMLHRIADRHRTRVAAGDVPEPLEGGARVAEFQQKYYSAHRFRYDQ